MSTSIMLPWYTYYKYTKCLALDNMKGISIQYFSHYISVNLDSLNVNVKYGIHSNKF